MQLCVVFIVFSIFKSFCCEIKMLVCPRVFVAVVRLSLSLSLSFSLSLSLSLFLSLLPFLLRWWQPWGWITHVGRVYNMSEFHSMYLGGIISTMVTCIHFLIIAMGDAFSLSLSLSKRWRHSRLEEDGWMKAYAYSPPCSDHVHDPPMAQIAVDWNQLFLS